MGLRCPSLTRITTVTIALPLDPPQPYMKQILSAQMLGQACSQKWLRHFSAEAKVLSLRFETAAASKTFDLLLSLAKRRKRTRATKVPTEATPLPIQRRAIANRDYSAIKRGHRNERHRIAISLAPATEIAQTGLRSFARHYDLAL